MKRECSLFAIAILAVACDQKPAPKRTLPPVSLVKPSAPPAAPAQAMYVYSPVSKGDPKRDPFQSNQSMRSPRPDGPVTNLLQKWPVGDLRVSFTLTGTATPKAVLETPEKQSVLIGIGDYVGTNWGKVTAIQRDQVIVTEAIGGPGGRYYRQPIKLLVPAAGDPGHGPVIDVPTPSPY